MNDLFSDDDQPTTPAESAQAAPVESAPVAGPELDWQPQPQRFYPDGKPRPRFNWPINYEAKQTRDMNRKIEEYREAKTKDRKTANGAERL